MSNPVHLIILLNFVVLKTLASDTDYCKLFCENFREGEWVIDKNSACNCPKPAPQCEEVQEDFLEFRQWMLDEHNELRNHFALGNDTRWPNKVANIHALSYDYDLEHTVRCHYSQCTFAHDRCRRTLKFERAGQNLLFGPRKSITEMEHRIRIKQWYDELQYLDLGGKHAYLIDKFNHEVFQEIPDGKKVGHFTQFVWAMTTHVGCVRFYNASANLFYLGCNYGPVGNVDGEPMFIRGEPCSKCGDLKCNQQYKGLCGETVLPPEPPKKEKKESSTNADCSKLQSDYFLLYPLFILLNIY